MAASISVSYDDEEKEVRVCNLDPEGSDIVLALDEAYELFDALSDALPDPDDVESDDLDESADDDDEDFEDDDDD